MKSGFKACPPDGRRGSVGLDLSLFADIPRTRRRIGRHKHNTQKLLKRIFAYFRNRLCHRCHTMFADAESAHHPCPTSGRRVAGGADNNLQPCKETTYNPDFIGKPFLTVNGYNIFMGRTKAVKVCPCLKVKILVACRKLPQPCQKIGTEKLLPINYYGFQISQTLLALSRVSVSGGKTGLPGCQPEGISSPVLW